MVMMIHFIRVAMRGWDGGRDGCRGEGWKKDDGAKRSERQVGQARRKHVGTGVRRPNKGRVLL